MDTESRLDIKKIWLGYIVSIALFGAVIGGFLFFITDDESRFRLGGIVLTTGPFITYWFFDRLLPKRNSRVEPIFIFLDVLMVGFIYFLLWQISHEVDVTQEAIISVTANPLIWLAVWAVLAISRLKDCLRLIEKEKRLG